MNGFGKNSQEDEKEEKEKPGGNLTDKLLKARKIVVSSEVDSKLANKVVHQLLLLEQEDPDSPITMFINSPGGEIFSGFAIYDMMQFIKPVVRTVVMGFAASMGSILSVGGAPGHRFALENSMILIHQPLISGVYRGSAADIEIQAKEMINTKNKIINIYVEATGKSYEDVKADIDRDYWMTAQQAADYGPKSLIDKVITSSADLDG
ncbi:MAG: ATP-dependent Clp protease proteolytic subunit [Spirochaetota bacterium]|nr:ATP-dependent Clp protease proteolytic subunit [Spirochaetota bacterium]